MNEWWMGSRWRGCSYYHPAALPWWESPCRVSSLHGDKTSRGGPGGRRPEALGSWKGLSRRNNDHDVQRHSGPSRTCLGGLEEQELARSEHVPCVKHSVDTVKCTHSATLPGAMRRPGSTPASGHIGQKVTPGPSSPVTTKIEDTLILHKKGTPVTKVRTIVVSIWKIEM